jgi:hypothetical protein
LRLARPNGEEVADKIRATEQLLTELRQRHEALLAAIAAVDEEEESYAVEGRDYTDLQRLRSKRGRLEWDLRQVDEQPLLDQLTALRAEQRRQRLEMFQSTQRDQLERGIKSLEAAFAAFDEARDTWTRAASAGFEREMLSVVDIWTKDSLERLKSLLGGQPFPEIVPQPIAAAPAGERQRLPHEAVGHGAASYAPSPPVRPPVRALRRAGPPAAGQRQIVLLRAGVEFSDGFIGLAGDIINVPADQAVELIRHSAADYTAVSGG